jgi:hypothetical protein
MTVSTVSLSFLLTLTGLIEWFMSVVGSSGRDGFFECASRPYRLASQPNVQSLLRAVEIWRALFIVRGMVIAEAAGAEETATAHVDGFVRTVLGVPLGSAIDLPAMPPGLSRLLLRREELEHDVRDRWGRWEFGHSENFRRGKLGEPEVDVWLAEVRKLIGTATGAPLWPDGHSFVVCPSHDVDMMTRTWTPGQVVRSLAFALSGSRGKDRTEAVLKACGRAVVYGTSRAPSSAATLQRCIEIELARDVRGSYFFTVHPPGRASWYDSVYKVDDHLVFGDRRRCVRDVMNEIVQAGFDVGLHGSSASATDARLLSTQRQVLEDAIDREVRTIRQHWLHWDVRATPAAQAAAGFKADSTLGFNRSVGFRAGTSFPFFLSTPEPFHALDVLEVPLIAQESALFSANALELDESLAREVVQMLVDRVAAVGGVFTALIHPHSLLDGRVASLYTWLLDYALDRGAWVTSVAEIDAWWRRRAQALADASPSAA